MNSPYLQSSVRPRTSEVVKGGKPSVCVDLDGVVTVPRAGSFREDQFGRIVPGTRRALRSLRERGWVVIIHTSRCDESKVKSFLDRNRIPYDSINRNPLVAASTKLKPLADVYVDDRGVSFSGDWKECVRRILSFRVWYYP